MLALHGLDSLSAKELWFGILGLNVRKQAHGQSSLGPQLNDRFMHSQESLGTIAASERVQLKRDCERPSLKEELPSEPLKKPVLSGRRLGLSLALRELASKANPHQSQLWSRKSPFEGHDRGPGLLASRLVVGPLCKA